MTDNHAVRLEIPPVFEVVHLDSGEAVLDATVALARQGATEGTLVWASRQPDTTTRPGRSWYSPDQGLYLGLVLEPDFAPERAGEIGLIALVAMGLALAEEVVAMTDLRYRWPNDILLSGSKVGGLWLKRDIEAGWLVLGMSVNVGAEPEQAFGAGCVQIEGGNADVSPQLLLQGFARQFLSWLNTWAEEGLEPILRQFRMRHDGPGASWLLQTHDGESVAGVLCDFDQHGSIHIDLDGQRRSISLNEFFGL